MTGHIEIEVYYNSFSGRNELTSESQKNLSANLPERPIKFINIEAVEKLQKENVELWNALQAITESGVVDCPECKSHERIARKALSDFRGEA